MTGQQPSLVVEDDGPVLVLRLNRPEVRNAVDDELQERILSELERICVSVETRAVVLTGTGSAFCSGGDVRGMKSRLAAPPGQIAAVGRRRLRRTQRMVSLLADLEAVTIAAVNGPAMGVGLDLALACDLIVAADTASFAAAYLQRGLVPDGGALYFLPRRIGLAATKDLVFSGRRVTAAEALALGLADRLVPADALQLEALSLARGFASGSRTAIAFAKSIVNRTFESTREDVLERSADAQAVCYTTDEHRAAVDAFLERSKPGDRSD